MLNFNRTIDTNYPRSKIPMMVHSQKFCHILAEQLGWNENHSYRVPGTVFEDQQIARFDLSRANMIQQTNSVPKDPMPQSNTKQSEIKNA